MVATIPVPTNAVMGKWGKAYTTGQVSRLAPPTHTDTHRPKDHHTLFDMVSNALQRADYEHSEPLHYVGDGKVNGQEAPAKFMTVMNIRHRSVSNEITTFDRTLDVNRQLFIQNSYDKSLSIRLIAGIEMCICSNGLTMGMVEDEIRRKQTKNVDADIYSIVYGGVDKMLGQYTQQVENVQRLGNTEMTDRMADHIIMEAMRRKVINPAGVGDVWDKWENPNYDEYKGRNAWSLVNAFTERSRGRSMFNRHKRDNDLLRIVDEFTGHTPEVVAVQSGDDYNEVHAQGQVASSPDF